MPVHRGNKRILGVPSCQSPTYSLETESFTELKLPLSAVLAGQGRPGVCFSMLITAGHSWSCPMVMWVLGVTFRFKRVHSECSYLLISPHSSTKCFYKAREFQVGNDQMDVRTQDYRRGCHR